MNGRRDFFKKLGLVAAVPFVLKIKETPTPSKPVTESTPLVTMIPEDRYEKAIRGFFFNRNVDNVPRFTSIRGLYEKVSADKTLKGDFTFRRLFGTALNNAADEEFDRIDFGWWKKLASSIEYDNLSNIPYSSKIPGGIRLREDIKFYVTEDMIRNDDSITVRAIPRELAGAAMFRLNRFVMEDLLGRFRKATVHRTHPDMTVLTVYAVDQVGVSMRKSGGPIPPKARYLVTSDDLANLAAAVSSHCNNIEVISSYFPSDSWFWFLVADPMYHPTLQILFSGRTHYPNIVMKDSPPIGSIFEEDRMTFRLSHHYWGKILDERAFG